MSPSDEAAAAAAPNHPRRRSSSKKIPVFEDSGLTDAERRQLRHDQRALQQQIETGRWDELRKRNNVLFQSVCYTREAVLDADTVDMMAQKMVSHVATLQTAPKYDAIKLIAALRSKCGDRQNGLDWLLLGNEAGICFNAIPERVHFWSGPIDGDVPLVPKKKQQQQRRPDEVVALIRPEQGNDAPDADKLSASEQSLKIMKQALKQKYKQSNKPLCGLQFLLNPKSFTETVENLFHFSFLIKKGEAGWVINEEQGLQVMPTQQLEQASPTQAVCSFTMEDWRQLCKAYNITTGDLPHRATKRAKS